MSQSEKRVLVLGANGRLGAACCAAFAEADWLVHAIARAANPALANRNAFNVKSLAANLSEIEKIVAFAQGASAVVYCANPAYTKWPQQAQAMLDEGLAIARRLDALFLFPGNVYNFGQNMPQCLDSDTAQQPSTRKGEIRRQMELSITRQCERGLRAITLRAGDFIGAGRGSWIDQVIAKSLSSGRIVYPGPLDVAHAWAYLPDLASAFVALAQRDRLQSSSAPASYESYTFAGHTLTGAELLDAIEAAARATSVKQALKRGSMPWRLYRALSLVVPMLREIVEMEYLWRVPHCLDGDKLKQAIGVTTHTPIDVAMKRTLEALNLRFADSDAAANSLAHQAYSTSKPTQTKSL
jgi:nucleoside-diphosphate-sugar epimerase